jgi:hypothetical protein
MPWSVSSTRGTELSSGWALLGALVATQVAAL